MHVYIYPIHIIIFTDKNILYRPICLINVNVHIRFILNLFLLIKILVNIKKHFFTIFVLTAV